MAEDEEETEELDFDEFMEAIEEQRRERREQVSFEWVETIRQAGELYRESEDIEAVAEELNRSEERTKEAIKVYRLIFEEPPEQVAVKASTPGRVFFSLDQDVDEEAEGDEEEPVEDLLREYVGAIYLEHDVGEEPVGNRPEEATPPLAVDFAEIGEQIADSFRFPSETILAASRIGELQQLVVNSAISGAMSDMLSDIRFPESVFADLASIQPAINTAAVAGASSTPSSPFRSVTSEASTTTVEAGPLEATASTVPSVSPANATVDATLPDLGAFSTEMAFEIPAMLVQATLSTGKARTWFTSLSEEHQISAVRVLLVAIAFYLTGNPWLAGLAYLIAPSVRLVVIKDLQNDD